MAKIDELFEALGELSRARGDTVSTSLRQPRALRRAARLATELGMNASLTTAMNDALERHIRSFARQCALTAYLDRYPKSEPDLATVAKLRAEGTDHPATSRPDLVDAVARLVAGHEPHWARTDADATVDRVLDHVELLVDSDESLLRKAIA